MQYNNNYPIHLSCLTIIFSIILHPHIMSLLLSMFICIMNIYTKSMNIYIQPTKISFWNIPSFWQHFNMYNLFYLLSKNLQFSMPHEKSREIG